MSETDLMRQMRINAAGYRARLFRQQSGMGWTGSKVERVGMGGMRNVPPGSVILTNARPFHAGFEGLSDLGGWVKVEITPDMVGKTLAVYAQVEVKEKARATEAQKAWINAVNDAGGRAGIARNDDDLAAILKGLNKV